MKLNKWIVEMLKEPQSQIKQIAQIHLKQQKTLQCQNLDKSNKTKGSFLGLLSIFFLFSTPLLAASGTEALSLFQDGIKSLVPAVKSAMLWVFWTLVVIDWVWTFGKLALSGFEMGEFLSTLIKKIMFIGVILFLFNVDIWLSVIADSFSQLAFNATGRNINPDRLLNIGLIMLMVVWDGIGWDIAQALFMLIMAGFMLLALALMAIELVMVYVKLFLMSIVIYFALAMGGIEHFRQTALNPILAVIKAGIELFVISALIGLSVGTLGEIQQKLKEEVTIDLMGQALVVVFLFVVVIKMVPSVIEAVLNGAIGDHSAASAGFKQVAAFTAGAAAGAAASTVANTVGMTRAMSAAKDLHHAQGGDPGMMNVAKGTMSNMATAYKEAMAGSMAGEISGKKGAMGHVMANKMQGMAEAERASSGSDSSSGGGEISGGNK